MLRAGLFRPLRKAAPGSESGEFLSMRIALSGSPSLSPPAPAGFLSAPVARTIALALVVGLSALFLSKSSARSRDALWQVDRACVVNRELTGSPFPCLSVNLDKGETLGFAVLRPPIGRPDTILVPTRPSVGIEDPWLQDPAAPNYLAAAWGARALATGGAEIADDRLGLAINSRFARSQDQFHIHIGCLEPLMRRWMREEGATLAPGYWRPLERQIGSSEVWALAIPSDDLAGVNPLRLAATGLPGAEGPDGLAFFTLALGPAKLAEGRDGFVAFAWRHDPRGSGNQMTAEDFLSPRCR